MWTDNIRLMEALSVEGIISGTESQVLQEAYVGLRQVMHRLTLQEKSLVINEDLFKETATAVSKIYAAYLKQGGYGSIK